MRGNYRIATKFVPWEVRSMSCSSQSTRDWLSIVLYGVAIALLLWALWSFWGSNIVAEYGYQRSVDDFHQSQALTPSPSVQEEHANGVSVKPHRGELIGTIRIDRFGEEYEVPLVEGTNEAELRKGIGHYAASSLPCAEGNFAVAGHRVTYGQPLSDIDQLRRGDRLRVRSLYGSCTYVVSEYVIVAYDDHAALKPPAHLFGMGSGWMTLTSCHPKYSDRERYIVYARLDPN